MTTRFERWKPLLLAVPFGILYQATRAGQFSYDGVLYALDVEFGSTAQLFHPGHLLYSFLFRLFSRLAYHAGYHGRALFLMQSANAWIGGLAVGFLAMTLSRRFGIWRGVLAAGVFGLSQAFWIEAIDPGCYALAGLGAVGVLALLLDTREKKAWMTGLLHGFLILIHQLFIFAIPAFWIAFGLGARPRRVKVAHYTLGLLLGAGLPYVSVAVFLHPGSLFDKLNWFLIPAGTPSTVGVFDNFWWNWNVFANIKPFWNVLSQTIVAHALWGTLVVDVGVLCLLFGSFQYYRKRGAFWPDMQVVWEWVIPMGIFLLFFHHAMRFHVLILPPVLYLLAALSTKLKGRAWGIMAGAALVFLGAVNYSRAVLPRRSGGDQLVRITWVQAHVMPIDFLLFTGRGPHSIINVYMAYFLPQIPARSIYGHLLNQFGRTGGRMDDLTGSCQAAWKRGGKVWVEKDLLDPVNQKDIERQMKVPWGRVSFWFRMFKKFREAPGPDGYALVELKPAFQTGNPD